MPLASPLTLSSASQLASEALPGVTLDFSTITLAVVDGVEQDLSAPLEKPVDRLVLATSTSERGRRVLNHSAAHLLGAAMEQSYPGTWLHDGPPIDPAQGFEDTSGGFFYEAQLPGGTVMRAGQPMDDLLAIMNYLAKKAGAFTRLDLTRDEARELFADNPVKLDLIEKFAHGHSDDWEGLSAYRVGPFVDLCRGPHIPTSSQIRSMVLTAVGGAGEGLQRVYGMAWGDKGGAKRHGAAMRDAAKRDHRSIGEAQALWMIDTELSPGCPFFLPNGTVMYNRVVDLMRAEYVNRGYSEVRTPVVFDGALWEKSGHAANYAEDMFHLVEPAGSGLKPMNCPSHCLIFDSLHKRGAAKAVDMPIRLADFGMLHRNEVSGSLSGLTRVRSFCQDDAHIFCTPGQIHSEVSDVLGFIKHIYSTVFGFTDLTYALATKPDGPNVLGSPDIWMQAEEGLRKALDSTVGAGQWELNEGDGAFYGPKIDVRVRDALGRAHQLGTVQLDFVLPERFELSFGDGSERPVMIHRAVLGSVERFLALLAEHTAGTWPFWMTPVQAVVAPVSVQSESQLETAQSIVSKAKAAGLRLRLAGDPKESLNKRIRSALVKQRAHFVAVIGDSEVSSGQVTLRALGGGNSTRTISVDEWIQELVSANALPVEQQSR